MSSQLQHYVPRFLLRQFGSDEEKYVYVFDKHNNKQFKFSSSKKSSISAAAEHGMYDFDFMGIPVTIEQSISELETKASDQISQILKTEQFMDDDGTQRQTIAAFLAVQMVRTRSVLELQIDFKERMKSFLKAEGMTDEYFADDPQVGGGENADKAFFARQIINAPKRLLPLLLEKDWLLLKTSLENPFLIGDHPCVLHNDIERKNRGNLGLKVEGIQVYFPISPTLALGVWCPSLRHQLLKFVTKMDKISFTKKFSASEHLEPWKIAIDTLEAIQKNMPLNFQAENVEHLNSLQVINSERFIFSTNGDFSIAVDMLKNDESLRRSPRMVEASGKF